MTSSRLLQSRRIPESETDESDIVVDCLGDADHRHRRSSTLQLLTQRMRAALRAVSADAKQDVDPTGLQKVGHHGGRLAAAGTAQHGAAQLVDRFDKLLGQRDRLQAGLGIQAQIAVADTEHTLHAVILKEFIKHRANHVVQSRRQTAASHDGSGCAVRLKVNTLPRPGDFKRQRISSGGARTQHNIEPNTIGVGSKVTRVLVTGRSEIQWRSVLALAK